MHLGANHSWLVSRVYRKCRFFIQQVSLKNASASRQSQQGLQLLKRMDVRSCFEEELYFGLSLVLICASSFILHSSFFTLKYEIHINGNGLMSLSSVKCQTPIFVYRMLCCPFNQVSKITFVLLINRRDCRARLIMHLHTYCIKSSNYLSLNVSLMSGWPFAIIFNSKHKETSTIVLSEGCYLVEHIF